MCAHFISGYFCYFPPTYAQASQKLSFLQCFRQLIFIHFEHVYILLMVDFKSAALASSSDNDVRANQFHVHVSVSVMAFLTTLQLY